MTLFWVDKDRQALGSLIKRSHQKTNSLVCLPVNVMAASYPDTLPKFEIAKRNAEVAKRITHLATIPISATQISGNFSV